MNFWQTSTYAYRTHDGGRTVVLALTMCHLFMTQAIIYGVRPSVDQRTMSRLLRRTPGFCNGVHTLEEWCRGIGDCPVTTTPVEIQWILRTLGIWRWHPIARVIRKRQDFGRGKARVGLKLVQKRTFLYRSVPNRL